MKKYRSLIVLILLALIVVLVGVAISASVAARRASASAVEENMRDILPTILRQPSALDRYTLPDGTEMTVHTLALGPSNSYLIETDAGMVLIDAGSPLMGSVVTSYLEEIGRDDLKLIFITHAHIDHYGSAAAIRRETGAPIAIHPDDAEHMAAGKTELGMVRDWAQLSNWTLPWIEPLLTIEETEADILVEDGERLDEYGLPATVVHVPGHTPGSSAVVVDGGVSFVGDLLSATGDPHVQESYAYDWSLLSGSLRRLLAYEPTYLYAGHGARPIDGANLNELITEYEAELAARRSRQ
jgi:hydroxyacylglutathione hydrolase